MGQRSPVIQAIVQRIVKGPPALGTFFHECSWDKEIISQTRRFRMLGHYRDLWLVFFFQEAGGTVRHTSGFEVVCVEPTAGAYRRRLNISGSIAGRQFVVKLTARY